MKVVVGPLQDVADLCRAHRPSHLVSWLSPPAEPPELPGPWAPPARLLLTSHDIAAATEGFEAPCEAHVRRLLEFAAAWEGRRPMLVHCWAGVSRSTAAAYVVACQACPGAPEAELALRLRSLAPTATPNPLIVAIADALLGRQGRMTQAVAAIGRGRETLLGEPFVLDLRQTLRAA